MNQAIPKRTPLRITPYLKEGVAQLGEVQVRSDIKSRMGPFHTFPDYRVVYPKVVVQALMELYVEYNAQFDPLATANREWETDYQYCVDVAGGSLNRWVQIDMVGLPEQFLEHATAFTVDEVKETLRHYIFEIENSLAMYQLLERINLSSQFRETFRVSLEELRRQYEKPIALLAVTQDKYEALLADEFGLNPGDSISDAEVLELSGFDRLFSPEEFKAHVAENDGECRYLLYVRSSDPTTKLRRPEKAIEHPLLGDPDLRRVIRANSLTFNIDDPASPSERCINDTKAYLTPMEMAFTIAKETDLVTPEFLKHIQSGRENQFVGVRLQPDFHDFLIASGIDPVAVATGECLVRVKPLKGTYGCYGHFTINLSKGGKKRGEWRKQLAFRGDYVVQPELATALVSDSQSEVTYGYIDRNFFTLLKGEPVFMSGFRTMLAITSDEALKGRFHGNDQTVWAAIN